MPPKRSEATHFEKVFALFKIFFLREPKEWTVRELQERLKVMNIDCAPNTIRNLIESLRKAMGDDVIREEKRGKNTYYFPTIRYRVQRPGELSSFSLVDYSSRSNDLRNILKAIEKKIICQLQYEGLSGKKKEHIILPLKAISYHDVIYIYAWRYPDRTTIEKEAIINGEEAPGYHILFTFTRIKSVSFCRNRLGASIRLEKYAKEHEEFLKTLSERCFGLIKGEKFKVRIKFEPQVATYLKERTWSEGEQYPKENEIVFFATSQPEVKSWVLSFGKNLTLLEPEDLRQEIIKELVETLAQYFSCTPELTR